eukprot:6180649-Pleurochrysis_carterae.AAC.1
MTSAGVGIAGEAGGHLVRLQPIRSRQTGHFFTFLSAIKPSKSAKVVSRTQNKLEMHASAANALQICRNNRYFGGIKGAFTDHDGVILLLHSWLFGIVIAYVKVGRINEIFDMDLNAEDVEEALGRDHQ